jgi:hypothetical protein
MQCNMHAYVMLQNDRLHAENAELRDRLASTKKALAASETESDALERGRNCLRGIVHNKLEEFDAHERLCARFRGKLHDADAAVRGSLIPVTMAVLVAPFLVSLTSAMTSTLNIDASAGTCPLTLTLRLVMISTALMAYAAALRRAVERVRAHTNLERDTEVCALARAVVVAGRANAMLHELMDNL